MTIYLRKITEYDPLTRIAKLACGHWLANITSHQAGANRLNCPKCIKPIRPARSRRRQPFWLNGSSTTS